MQEQIVIPIAGMTMIVLLVLGVPFVRALARRWESQPLQPVPPEVAARLERIEQAVDAVAFEVGADLGRPALHDEAAIRPGGRCGAGAARAQRGAVMPAMCRECPAS